MRFHIRVIQRGILESASGISVVERVVEDPHFVLLVRDYLPGGGSFLLLVHHLGLDQLLVRVDCLQVELLVNVGLYEALLTLRVETGVEGTAFDSVLKLDTTFLIGVVPRHNWYNSWVLHVH